MNRLRRHIIHLLPAIAAILLAPHVKAQQSVSAIYEGIVGYGVSDDAAGKDSFRFRFHVGDSISRSFLIGNDSGDYRLQNDLIEGERFIIEPDDNDGAILTAVKREKPVAQGVVDSVTESAITIGGRNIPLADSVVVNEIIKKPGGSEVHAIDTVEPGDMVKVYGWPVSHIDRRLVAETYTPPVSGRPGVRTLKNFLQTAFTPVGTTLYVYGGAWNWQDDASGPTSRQIGLPADWVEFFQMNDAAYSYKAENHAESYYPWHRYNEYHNVGADCSGFVGWTIYNTMNQSDGESGYVMPSLKMAWRLSSEYGFGEFSNNADTASFDPGDVVSFKGHVYIVVGRAADGSLVIVHSTTDGKKGSGVQLSGVGLPGCDAHRLAAQYMQRYYPQWSKRYEALCKSPEVYLDFAPATAGHLKWHRTVEGLEDPDGYADMTAEEILADIFSSVKPTVSKQ